MTRDALRLALSQPGVVRAASGCIKWWDRSDSCEHQARQVLFAACDAYVPPPESPTAESLAGAIEQELKKQRAILETQLSGKTSADLTKPDHQRIGMVEGLKIALNLILSGASHPPEPEVRPLGSGRVYPPPERDVVGAVRDLADAIDDLRASLISASEPNDVNTSRMAELAQSARRKLDGRP